VCPLLGLLLTGLMTDRASAQFQNAYNGHIYKEYFVPGGISWTDAKAAAESLTFLNMKGHLVTITNEVEYQFLLSKFTAVFGGGCWLGGYQDTNAPDYAEPGGGWRWVTGEKWSYTRWNTGEPNNAGGNENYLSINNTLLWNDLSNTANLPYYIVEFEAYPGDFNGDNKPDLIFQNAQTGNVAFWNMDGPNRIGGQVTNVTPEIGYELVGAGDFDIDSRTDLVFQNRTTGQIAIWYMYGPGVTNGNIVNYVPDPGYKVAAVADISGDSRADLIFQNQNTGQVAFWYMSNYSVSGGAFCNYLPDAGYKIVGAADFNGDGKTDLVFQNQTTGRIAIWYMDGPNVTSGAFTNLDPDTNYKVVGIADINGDGKPDFIFQNTVTGQIAFWYMNNNTVTGGAFCNYLPQTGWNVVGPR
jgi:hypothetical protein